MANDTFGQIWNKLLIHVPNLPPPLAREFVRLAYREAVDAHYWSDLRTDAEILCATPYSTGTITMTNGDATVTGSGTAWTTAAHQFKQLAVGSIAPWYTIASVTSPTELELDRNFEGATAAGETYQISNYYIDFPQDLEVLEKIRDQNNGWYLSTQWYTQEYLDRIDPKRNTSGTPTIAVMAPSRTDSSGNIIPRYEFWPRSDSQRLYHYRYTKHTELSSNTSRPIERIRANTILYGALKHASMWPGTPDSPNPLFGSDKQEAYMRTFDQLVHDDTMADIDRNQTMVQIGDDLRRRFPVDAAYLQEHYW